MFLYSLVVLISTLILYLVIAPLTKMIPLKLKYGNKVKLYYFPLLGMIKLFNDGIKYHQDFNYYKRNAIKGNPDVKVSYHINVKDIILYTFIEPQSAKIILTEHSDFQKDDTLIFNEILFRKGLIFTEGKRWRDQRNIIGHQFKYETFKDRVSYMKDVVKNVFSEQIKDDQEVKIINVCGEITGQVVSLTFFGEDVDKKHINGIRPTELMNNLIQDILKQSFQSLWAIIRIQVLGYGGLKKPETPDFLLTNKEKKLKQDLITLREYIRAIINTRIEKFEDYEKMGNKDFLQIYIQEMRKQPDIITVEEIIQQYLTFFFAGMDTTSHLAGMACYCLAIYPEVQIKLRQQVQDQIKDFDEIQLSDLSKIPYLQAFIDEVLRLYPPADGLFPRRSTKDQLINDFFVPKGALVQIGIVPLMNQPKWFDKPDEFIVERWFEEKRPETFAYIPFSAGGRNCIGQHMAQIEAKIMLIYLVLNFHMYPDPERKLVKVITSLYSPEDQRIVRFRKLN